MEQKVHMREAEDLYTYSCAHNFGKGIRRSWGIQSFRLVEKALEAKESAYLAFIGLHRFHSMSAHQRNFAYAFTNKRIIMAQIRPFWRTRMESVPLNAILNLSFDSGASIGVLKIMMADDAICIGMARESAVALSKRLTELLPLIQGYAKQLSPAED